MGQSQAGFEAIDALICELFAPEDDALKSALAGATANGWPEIHVSAAQGKFLYLMARLIGARRILEVGTFTGYSTTWLARALPEDGQLVTLELLEVQASVAQETFENAGLSDRIDLRQGRALHTLEEMARHDEPPFDMVFLDANKDEYPDYLKAVTPLLRSGGLLLGDNVVRNGTILEPQDPGARGARTFVHLLSEHPDYEAIVHQQVGPKGWDGLAIARKR